MKIEIQTAADAKAGRGRRVVEKTANGPAELSWKTILAPTDLSKPSKCAIKTAAALAQKCKAKLILLHVVQCPACASFDAPPDAERMMEEAREALEDVAQTMLPGVVVEKIVRFGTREPVKEIIEEASHASADLIVIATHGYSGLKRVLMGSTAERVVRHAPCPVLVVRRAGNRPGQTGSAPETLENPFSPRVVGSEEQSNLVPVPARNGKQ